MSEATETLAVHPYAKIIPEMAADQYAALEEDVRRHGQRDPIRYIVEDGKMKIVDGRHRYKICRKLKIDPKIKELKPSEYGLSLLSWIASHIVHRHLTAGQRAAVGAELEPMFAKEAKMRQIEGARKGGAAKAAPGGANAKNATIGPKSRELAGAASGASPANIQRMKAIKKADPALAEQVKNNEKSVAQATAIINRRKKTDDMNKAAATAPAATDAYEVVTGDSDTVMPTMKAGSFQLAIMDPPYNIGVNYGGGANKDRLAPSDYLSSIGRKVKGVHDVLSPSGTFFLICGQEYAPEIGVILKTAGFTIRRILTWYETFGANCTNNFNATSRPVFYCVKNPKKFTFNPDAISRKSARQEQGDKRAAPHGKLWDDVLMIPRLNDNAKERVPGFPTQLPLQLVTALIEVASMPGDHVLDPCSGSGTTIHACLTAPSGVRHGTGIELSKDYAELSRKRLAAAANGGKAPKAPKAPAAAKNASNGEAPAAPVAAEPEPADVI